MEVSRYYDPEYIKMQLENGNHRGVVGGMWEEVGDLQLSFLISNGMKPHHSLLDIGCGTLRLGARAVDYLKPDNYWGTDLNEDFLDVGYQKEIIDMNLSHKLPRENLISDQNFDFVGIPDKLNFIISTSVFTHLTLNHIRLCFARLCEHLSEPSIFYFSIFMPDNGLVQNPCLQKDGIISYPERDPYHYTFDDIEYLARGLPMRLSMVGDWHHPRNQKIVRADIHAKFWSKRLRLWRGVMPTIFHHR